MKRIVLCILFLLGIVVCMTGCNVNNILKTEEEKNDEKCQQIIMSTESHNGDALKNFFQKQRLMKQAILVKDVITFFLNTTVQLNLLNGQDIQVIPIMNQEILSCRNLYKQSKMQNWWIGFHTSSSVK